MALGIPALYQGFQVKATSILTTIKAIVSVGQEKKIYALIDKDGNKVLNWDSCISFVYKNSSTITEAPQESGAFISYNKVGSPFIINTRGTSLKSGDRKKFIEEANGLLLSLELYDFITPEQTYKNVNLTALSNAKEATAGYSIVAIDFTFQEVVLNNLSRRELKTAEPSGESEKSTGQVVAA